MFKRNKSQTLSAAGSPPPGPGRSTKHAGSKRAIIKQFGTFAKMIIISFLVVSMVLVAGLLALKIQLHAVTDKALPSIRALNSLVLTVETLSVKTHIATAELTTDSVRSTLSDAALKLKSSKTEIIAIDLGAEANEAIQGAAVIIDDIIAQIANYHPTTAVFPEGLVGKLEDLQAVLPVIAEFIETEAQTATTSANKMSVSLLLISVSLSIVALLAAIILFRMTVNRTRATINGLLKNLESHADNLDKYSSEMTQLAQQLHGSATSQSETVATTMTNMDSLLVAIGESNTSITGTATVTRSGMAVIEENSQTMGLLSSASAKLAAVTDQLGQLKTTFSDIKTRAKSINDIVFETRLLSFNAAIEAARAGQHGKGFSVVAEEVGKLASATGTAATGINSVMNQSEGLVSEASDEIENKVQEVRTIADKVAADFSRIESMFTDIAASVKNIDRSAQAQATAVAETKQSMATLQKISSDYSTSAKILTENSQKLDSGAKQLGGLVSQIGSTLLGN